MDLELRAGRLAEAPAASGVAPRPLPLARRLWLYQRERFPVLAHGALILAFSLSAVSFTALLRGAGRPPALASAAVAFVTSFCFFLQLRIADEFKDRDEDRRWRPYRPVPRGLVTLRELGLVWAATATLQLALALWLAPWLCLWLLLAWAYLALMTREFFARAWLKARPVAYLASHLLILPLVDFYATATDWVRAGRGMPAGLGWFLGASYANGVVIELGRKLRAPEDEEEGVPTYTALWGRPVAVAAWAAALLATLACAAMAAARIGSTKGALVGLAPFLGLAGVLAARFLRRPAPRLARWFEPLSGAWTVALYLSLGVVPMALKALG